MSNLGSIGNVRSEIGAESKPPVERETKLFKEIQPGELFMESERPYVKLEKLDGVLARAFGLQEQQEITAEADEVVQIPTAEESETLHTLYGDKLKELAAQYGFS